MNFNTLISQVSPLLQPVKPIANVEHNTVYYSYTADSFVEYPSLTPYSQDDYYGYGKVTFVVNWDNVIPDQANIKLRLSGIGGVNLDETVYDIDEEFIIGVPKTIEMNFPKFNFDVLAFEVSPEFPAPTTPIIKIDFVVSRCNNLYEVI